MWIVYVVGGGYEELFGSKLEFRGTCSEKLKIS